MKVISIETMSEIGNYNIRENDRLNDDITQVIRLYLKSAPIELVNRCQQLLLPAYTLKYQ